MAINITFDANGIPTLPTVVLCKKNGEKINGLKIENVTVKDDLNEPCEIKFVIRKYVAHEASRLWDDVVDFRLVYVKEWDMYFEIKVDIDETDDTTKTVYGTQLGPAETSQIMLYGIEINTQDDIAREDYKTPTVLWNPEHPESSLLHRIMEKAPHYRIVHVSPGIAKMQRTFTFDGVSLYDAFQEIAEEIDCLFVFQSNSDPVTGLAARTICVYDMQAYCKTCGHRGDFSDACPTCHGADVTNGYGDDTAVFITADELGDEIKLTSDTGQIKNCFKLEAGDDLMTAAVRNCNPNGTDSIWYLSDDAKRDMSDALSAKIEQYDALYQKRQKDDITGVDADVVGKYNQLVEKYRPYREDLETIELPLAGYPALMRAYYNTVDLHLFLQSALMPKVSISQTTAVQEAASLTGEALSPVSVTDVSRLSPATADSVVLSVAKIVIRSGYRVEIESSDLNHRTWTGTFRITNYADEEDTAVSPAISVTFNDDYSGFVQQKLDKALKKEDADDLSVSGLMKKDLPSFRKELQKYCMDCLARFYDACQSCIDILIEQGVADHKTWAGSDPNLYQTLYVPYFQKLSAIESEMHARQSEIDIVVGADSENADCGGLQPAIVSVRNAIQNELDFQTFLGDDLWMEFCSFRREDKYANSNYISDGLNNAALFDSAWEFLTTARTELQKSAELQHNISTSLKNLFVIKKFRPFIKSFEVGNRLRIRADDTVYKLRLMNYEIDFDNIDQVSVEFSDVTAASDDAAKAIENARRAQAMATSYDSTKRQATKGQESHDTIRGWVEHGLDATNTRIMGGADGQTQTWDSHGMLFRKQDPVSGTYEPCQLKIVNSTLAITKDNWETTSTAVGSYYYVDPITKELRQTYGVNAETLVGKAILGEELGIYNESGSLSFDKNGFSVSNGVNSFQVDPNSPALLSLSNQDQKIFYVDENGSAVFSGTLESPTVKGGTVIGTQIDGGSITIGSGENKLTIYNNGYLQTTSTIESNNPNSPYATKIYNGQISIYGKKNHLQVLTGKICSGGSLNQDSTYDRFVILCESESCALDIGYRSLESSKKYSSCYTINNGLNPSGITQRNIFYEDEYHSGDMYVGNIRPGTDKIYLVGEVVASGFDMIARGLKLGGIQGDNYGWADWMYSTDAGNTSYLYGSIYANDSGFNIRCMPGKQIFLLPDYDSYNGSVGVHGNILYSGVCSQFSSKRYKENIASLTPDKAKEILKLNPVEFDYKKTGKHSYGLIAEETAEIIPDIVGYDEVNRPDNINYIGLIPYLIKVIQEQQMEIDRLKEKTEWLSKNIS